MRRRRRRPLSGSPRAHAAALPFYEREVRLAAKRAQHSAEAGKCRLALVDLQLAAETMGWARAEAAYGRVKGGRLDRKTTEALEEAASAIRWKCVSR